MLRIVLPAGVSSTANAAVAAATRLLGRTVTAAKVAPVAAANVRVAIEIVVVIDGDVVVTPAAAPAPTATPECSHHDADAERNC
jgi:hypothetical protein